MELQKEVIEKIVLLNFPKIIAVSGFGGSGKSSTAKTIGLALNAPVISVDSFQKNGGFDTQYSLWEIMDFDRLENEVLKPFLEKQTVIRYGHFDPNVRGVSKIIEEDNNGILIIEGVGLFRPELLKYFAFKIWIDVPIEIAIERGKKRDREQGADSVDEYWDGIWKENDMQCFDTFKPKEITDLVIRNY